MADHLLDWLQAVLRWAHVIAAILWIGDSFLFVWMDRSLTPSSRPRTGDVAGELWMVHSGGFYEVVKRRKLAPGELPARLHWFQWEAYSTWITGIFLLGVVYYGANGVMLVDRTVRNLSLPAAIAISLAFVIGGVVVYEALYRSPLAQRPRIAAVTGFALIAGAAWALTQLFGGRAAFVHVGAVLGTIMAANVAHHIIPAQRRMLAATRAGQPVDTAPGERAKMHSIHNHWLTLPVLFTMLANHLPAAYGSRHAWLVLVAMIVAGLAAKHVMSERRRSDRWAVAAGLGALAFAVAVTAPGGDRTALAELRGAPTVAFAEVRAILDRRCLTCHAAKPSDPSFPQPPAGVVLEDAGRVRALAPRILARAVTTRTMPLGNITGMTEDERRTLGAWIVQGAAIDSVPPSPAP